MAERNANQRSSARDSTTPLNLVGALVDLDDLGVTHHALDREVGGIAGAAGPV
jgi:hypothetical protein